MLVALQPPPPPPASAAPRAVHDWLSLVDPFCELIWVGVYVDESVADASVAL